VAAGPATGIVVEKIVSSDDGQTNFSGKADAGATLKIEINGKAAGETVVADDGDWSLAVANPTAKAAERVHLELVGKDGAALDKAVVPYKMAAPEVKVAAVEPPKDVEPAKEYPAVLTSKPDATKEDVTALFKTPEQASSEKPKRRIIRVRRGDSLWRISRRHLGNGKKWAKFYRLNKRKIDNPDLIYPGQTLILPG
jgi:nucleoid-associated protein YgaU